MSPAPGRAQGEPAWSQAPDQELLQLPLKRLGLRVDRGVLAPRVAQLHQELENSGLGLRPHVWLSVDWFSPDGVPGIALPFYLGHARLIQLERRQMTWAEGASIKSCMALLRHESGHCIDTAYGLSRRKLYRQTFGNRSDPYRRHYGVDPHSTAFVRYLPRWYAQSHPAEDFAESFAVWLTSKGRWRKRYGNTPAARKLEVVSELMDSIRGSEPAVRSPEEVESLDTMPLTLGAHYLKRRRRLDRDPALSFEAALKRRFPAGRAWNQRASAALLLTRRRIELIARAQKRLGCGAYAADQVIELMIHRARELGLTVPTTPKAFDLDALVRMIRSTLRALKRGDNLLSR